MFVTSLPCSGLGWSVKILLLGALSSWTGASILNDLLFDNYTLYAFPPSVKLKDGQVYDYIVVGAGAGGAPAAARLALAGHSVLLIEAGGDPNILTQIPSAAMGIIRTSIDWQYKTISNNVSCLSSDGKMCLFSRGKCLGGSTSINHMIVNRGNRKQDYGDIPYLGWTYDDLMPYFLRYEDMQDLDKLPASSRPYHNTSGFMRTSFFDDPQSSWMSRIVTAYKSLQFPLNPDVNAESQIGITRMLGYVYKGERVSTARGYLARDDVQRTLKVAKKTKCTGVIIDNGNVARGVTAVQGYVKFKLYARKEVILSAGTIGTPQILMLSGVGPADHLKSMGIPVKVDLPVGDGLIDHVLPVVIMQVDESAEINKNLSPLWQLLISRTGGITSNGLNDLNIFANNHCYNYQERRLVNQSDDGSDCEVPNMQIVNAHIDRYLTSLVKPIIKKSLGFTDDVIDQIEEANLRRALIVMTSPVLNPRSVGTVRLASTNPLAHPAIYPNFLGDERDVDEMLRSISIVEHIAETHPFARRNASLFHPILSGCPLYESDSEAYWRCYVRHLTFPGYHAAGTAALGRVLDERLRVLGVQRLRVADLSALPRVPHANTASITMAIGERAAEFILEDNK